MIHPFCLEGRVDVPRRSGAMQWIAPIAMFAMLAGCGDDTSSGGEGSGGAGTTQSAGSGSGGNAGDTSSSASASTGGSCEEYASSESECDQCVAASCCQELTACLESADCAAVTSCIFDECEVGDSECNDACQAAHPIGYAILEEYVACWDAQCMRPCSSLGSSSR